MSVTPDSEEFAKDRSCWRGTVVTFTTPEHDHGTEQENKCWKEERKPEAYVLLSVDHANLSNQGSNIDEEVEVVVDSGLCNGWINDDALARWQCLHTNELHWNLLNHQWRDVRLEPSCANTQDDDTEHEDRKRCISIDDDRWNGGDDE